LPFLIFEKKIATPLNRLSTKDISFKWTNECENAVKTLKQVLITAPVLGYPNFNKPFILALYDLYKHQK
jgi:hypothetical protein